MKILVNDELAGEAIDMLENEHDVTVHHYSVKELAEEIGHFNAILVRSATKLHDPVIFENAKALKVIGRAGVGTDNIDVARATELGIPVVYAPTGAMISVAELSIAHMLAFSRNIVRATNTMKKGEWKKKELKGHELHGRTLGLLGCGNIGQQTARYGKAFGMKIIYYRRHRDRDFEDETGAEYVAFDDLLKRSDFLSLHLPMNENTAGMISDDEFNEMKDGAVLVNCARGGVVEEDALYRALVEGKISGATVDVYEEEPPSPDNPLFTLDNVIFTPHLGATTWEAQIRAGTVTAEGILDVLEGRTPEFCKNPAVFP